MESFYSLIYYRPNSLTDELLVVGILASGGEGPFIHISRRRLDLLKKTIHSSQYTSINRHFKNLSRSVNADRKAPNELLLFDPNYSKERLEDLNKYTKGAVIYSAPITINEWLNESFFMELVKHFLGDPSSSVSRKKRPVFHLKWKAFCRSNQFDAWARDRKVSDLKDLSLPINLDLFSDQKKQIVKAIDFDLKPDNVRRKIHEVLLVADVFKDFEIKLVYPGPRKSSGKELLKSIDGTVDNINLTKFTEFRGNS